MNRQCVTVCKFVLLNKQRRKVSVGFNFGVCFICVVHAHVDNLVTSCPQMLDERVLET